MMRGSNLKYLILLGLAIAVPLFLTNSYHRHLLFMCCVYAMLALSADVIFGGMGQFTFGHQAFFGIGAYTSGKLSLSLGMTPLLAFLSAFILSSVFGLVIGYVCMRRLRTMYLALVTFGLGAMLYLIARNWHSFTGGLTGLGGIPVPRFFGFEFRTEFSYYYLSLSILILIIYFLHRLWRSRMGRAIAALRENEDLSRSIGVRPTYYYTLAFAIACGLAGLSGAVYVHSMAVVSPGLFHFQYMIIILISVLVGGMGTLPGPVIGAIVYVWMSEVLRFSDEFRFMIVGTILLLFVIFMPRGIYPSAVSFWGRFFVSHGSQRQLRREEP